MFMSSEMRCHFGRFVRFLINAKMFCQHESMGLFNMFTSSEMDGHFGRFVRFLMNAKKLGNEVK